MIKLLGDRIMVEPIRCDVEVASKIVIPLNYGNTKHLKYCRKATVIAVGPGRRTKKGVVVPIHLRPGDVVLYEKMLDSEEEIFKVKIGDKEYMILETKQIFGVQGNE